jgi:hypothetical protein
MAIPSRFTPIGFGVMFLQYLLTLFMHAPQPA